VPPLPSADDDVADAKDAQGYVRTAVMRCDICGSNKDTRMNKIGVVWEK
jgi:hypothetical protein